MNISLEDKKGIRYASVNSWRWLAHAWASRPTPGASHSLAPQVPVLSSATAMIQASEISCAPNCSADKRHLVRGWC